MIAFYNFVPRSLGEKDGLTPTVAQYTQAKKKTASNHQAGGAKSDFCFWQGALKLFRTAHLGFLLLPVQILSSLPARIDKRTIRLFNPVNRTVVWLPLL